MQFSDTATKLGKFMFRWWPTLLQRDCSNFSCQTNYRWTVLFSLLLVFEDVWWCWRLKKKKCEYSYAYCVKAAVMTMTVAIPIMMKEQIRISDCSATRGLSRRRWREKAGRFTTQCITNDRGQSNDQIVLKIHRRLPAPYPSMKTVQNKFWISIAVSGLPEHCPIFHFPPPLFVRPSVRHRRDISTFLDILTVYTMKTIYFLNAYHLGR